MVLLIHWKAILTLVSFLVILLITLVPFSITFFCSRAHHRRSIKLYGIRISKTLASSVITCFSAGVFIGTVFFHLLPETMDHYKQVLLTGRMDDFVFANENVSTSNLGQVKSNPGKHAFPTSMVFVLAGLFLGCFSDVITDTIVHHFNKKRKTAARSRAAVAESQSQSMLNNASSDTSATGHHSHDMQVREGKISDGITLVAAMALHSILEGIAIGISLDLRAFTTRLLAILLHKIFESLVVGVLLAKSTARSSKAIFLAFVTIFSIGMPVGIGIGIALTQKRETFSTSGSTSVMLLSSFTGQMALVVLEGLSTGMFVYIGFLELLAKEYAHPKWPWANVVSTLMGVVIIALLMLLISP